MKNSKYIVLGNGYGWCETCFQKVEQYSNVFFSNSILPINEKSFMGKLAHFHFSATANKFVELPCKHVWYKIFWKNMLLSESEHDTLIIFDNNKLGNDPGFLIKTREHFPKTKLVYAFTNIASKSRAFDNNFIDKLNGYYDIVLAFDKLDSDKYGFAYSPLVYSPLFPITELPDEKENNTAFYVGNAKDRFGMLISIFEKLRSMGVECDFNIARVPENERKYADEINYDCNIPYDDVLKMIDKSDILIDVIQGDSTGLTIKTCEAVYFDKKLITTNKHVEEYDFYDKNKILVINNSEDISSEFINRKMEKYDEKYKNYFSVESFFERIDSL